MKGKKGTQSKTKEKKGGFFFSLRKKKGTNVRWHEPCLKQRLIHIEKNIS